MRLLKIVEIPINGKNEMKREEIETKRKERILRLLKMILGLIKSVEIVTKMRARSGFHRD